jgi:hypothetical protein
MKFTVVSLPSVDAALAKIYTDATDPKTVTEASNWIDRQLKVDPLSKVTSLDDFYFIRRDPLVMLCKINEDDRLVTIIEVHQV